MNSTQQSINEQVKQVTDMQSKSLEPMRIFGGVAAEAMEQIIRKNYAVMGDFIDFSVKQAQLPLSGDNAGDVLSAQMEEVSAFGELMNSRASEYVELASSLSDHARKATEDATARAREVAEEAAGQVKKLADEATDRTKKAADEATDSTKKAADRNKKAA